MTIVIRAARPAEVAVVLALWRGAGAEPTSTDDAEGLLALLAHDAGALLVAEDHDGTLVGSVVAAWDGWRGSIYRLVVAERARRRGLGRRLLGAAESRLLAVGAHRMAAIVVETDPRATAFWAATRWERQRARVRYVRG